MFALSSRFEMVKEILQPFLFDCPYEQINPSEFADHGLYRQEIHLWTYEKDLFDIGMPWERKALLSCLESEIGPKSDFDSFAKQVKPLDRLFLVDNRPRCDNPMWKHCADVALRCWLWWLKESGVNVILVRAT